MTDAHTLTRHRDIQNWVAERHGLPAMTQAPNSFGEMRARLALRFDRPARPVDMPATDQGVSPVSWNAWRTSSNPPGLAMKTRNATMFFGMLALGRWRTNSARSL